jgi:glycosyltransferase involved in cell wall biosynthesis
LIVATSVKPADFDKELQSGSRYRLEYIELSDRLSATYIDYDPPGIHGNRFFRILEEKLRIDFYWAREIARKVEDEGYQVVLSMSERAAVPLAHVLTNHVKQVAVLINAFSIKWRTLLKTLRTYDRWDKIVVYSQAEAEALQREYQIEPEKIEVILNYVDTDFFKPPGENAPSASGDFILSQGLAKRDYPTLISAMRRLPHIDCYINATSAWDKHKAGYESIELPDNVHIKTFDHPSSIRDSMADCRFLVIPIDPNIGQWCTGSTSVMQAQSMAKPVVVTYLPGISEYILDGETGFLVEGENPTALAEAIDRIWRDPQLAQSMGKRGQAWMDEQFSLVNWVDNMTGLLDEFA